MEELLKSYDLAVVGTGFASSFFLHGWLRRAPADARVVVLERGVRRTHREQLDNLFAGMRAGEKTFVNTTPEKIWPLSVGFGGGSQCWWGCTPRMLPADFELQTRYGVGLDWPISYADLEPYYCEAEALMGVAGPSDTPWPMSRPYPQPAHRLQAPDRVLQEAFPGSVIAQPCARASASADRGICCANSVCSTCPVDAKFTIANGMRSVYTDPRVTLMTRAKVQALRTGANTVNGLVVRSSKGEQVIPADLIALGANAIINPWLLLRSGILEGDPGAHLTEQRSRMALVPLVPGLDGGGGGTSITALAYLFADGPSRRDQAACIVETHNRPQLHEQAGRWRSSWRIKFIFEDIPDPKNRVDVDPDDDLRPRVQYHGPSDYLLESNKKVAELAAELCAPIASKAPRPNKNMSDTESHILGTHRMGTDPAASVVDANLVHHRYRNLLVLGGGAFVTAAPANPTLTLSALSLRAAAGL